MYINVPHGNNRARKRRRRATTDHLLIFTLDRLRYALALDAVHRVVRAAAITALPKAPEVVLGVLDLQGELIPVVDLRKRFRLPEREIRSTDQFVVASTGTRNVALVVDGTEGVIDRTGVSVVQPDEIVVGTEFLAGVLRCADGLILLHDLQALLFPAEEKGLAGALREVAR